MDHPELESAASEVIGKIVFAFSRLEFNLGLCLRGLVGGSDVDSANPLIHRLTFKSKLDALLEVIEYKFSTNSDCINEFKKWHKRADELRSQRNSFLHGRWGILAASGEISNVAPGMPGTSPQRESRFMVSDLKQELAGLEEVTRKFSELRDKWHI